MSAGEVEVETVWVQEHRQRRLARFLKGPIQLELLLRAARLPGRALVVFLAIRHRADLRGTPYVTLPIKYLTQWGVGQTTKIRALAALERAGLIRIVDRRPGRSTVVAWVDTP